MNPQIESEEVQMVTSVESAVTETETLGQCGFTSDEIVSLLNHEAGASGLSGGRTNLGELAADPDSESWGALVEAQIYASFGETYRAMKALKRALPYATSAPINSMLPASEKPLAGVGGVQAVS